MYLSFVLGIILFSNGVVNLFSSLLLFVGGYISVKNTFDYRIINKNREKINNFSQNIENRCNDIDVRTLEIKRVKRNIRVRKREKK